MVEKRLERKGLIVPVPAQYTGLLPNYIVELLKTNTRVFGFNKLRMCDQTTNMRPKPNDGIKSTVFSVSDRTYFRMIEIVQMHPEARLELFCQPGLRPVHQ